MTHPAILALLSIPSRPLAAADVLARLVAEEPASIDAILAAQDEIQAAIDQADKLAYQSQKAIERCLRLKPTPAPKPPAGF